MREPLWTPSQQRVKESNITAFVAHVNTRYGLQLESHKQLHKSSIDAIPDFWSAVREFAGIRASQLCTQVFDDVHKFPGAKCFSGARLIRMQ